MDRCIFINTDTVTTPVYMAGCAVYGVGDEHAVRGLMCGFMTVISAEPSAEVEVVMLCATYICSDTGFVLPIAYWGGG